MSLLNSIRTAFARTVKGSLARWIFLPLRVHDVTAENSLEVPVFYQALQIIAGDIGQLPLEIYERTEDGGRKQHSNHPLYRILKRRPNSYMTPSTFKEYMQMCLLIFQNAFAKVARYPSTGEVFAIHPIFPSLVEMKEHPQTGKMVYYVDHLDEYVDQDDMIHLKGLTFNGLMGVELFRLAKSSLQMSVETEKMLLSCITNQAFPSSILSTDADLTDEDVKRLREDWEQLHKGSTSYGKVAILTGGMKYEPIKYLLNELEIAKNRQELRKDLASWFNLPPHKMGDLSDTNLTSIIEQNRDYLQRTLMRWIVKWQEELNIKLLRPEEQDRFYIEFNVNALLRGTIKERFEAYSIGISNGIMSPNECREKENLPRYDGGDQFYYPVNIAKEAGGNNENTNNGEEASSTATENETDMEQVTRDNG